MTFLLWWSCRRRTLWRDRLPQQGPGVIAAIERAQSSARHFPAVLAALELPPVGAHAVNAKPGRTAVAGQFARGSLPVGRDDLQVRRRDRGISIELDARQPGEMTEAAGDGGLMLGRLHDGRDRFIAVRTLATTEVDRAIRGECVAIVTVGPGIGRRRVAGDQVIDRERILHRAEAILRRNRLGHAELPS